MSNWKDLIFKARGFKLSEHSLVSFKGANSVKFQQWANKNRNKFIAMCSMTVAKKKNMSNTYTKQVVSQDYIVNYAMTNKTTKLIHVYYNQPDVTTSNFEQYGDNMKAFIILQIKGVGENRYVYVDVICGEGGGYFMFYAATELAKSQQIKKIRLSSVPTAMQVYALGYGFKVLSNPNNIISNTLTNYLKMPGLRLGAMTNIQRNLSMQFVKMLMSQGAKVNVQQGMLLGMETSTLNLKRKLNASGEKKVTPKTFTSNQLASVLNTPGLTQARKRQLATMISQKELKSKNIAAIRRSLSNLRKGDRRVNSGNVKKKIEKVKTPSIRKSLMNSLTVASSTFRSKNRKKPITRASKKYVRNKSI